MEGKRFRRIVVGVMAITGAMMLWQERGAIAAIIR
jgi:hypothetical protein